MKRMKSTLESVWDYPRPPRLERCQSELRVEYGGNTIARTSNGLRVLETSHPPTYYFPPADVRTDLLVPSRYRSWCEWKGQARYWTARIGDLESADAAWSYPNPPARFEALRDHFAFYPTRVEGCYVGDERVRAQEGDFYGGWITSEIVGPFKGGPGTSGW